MKKNIKKVYPYLILLFLTLFFLDAYLGIFHVDLSVPLYFKGDAILVYTSSKELINNEFFPFMIPRNSLLGAPGISMLGDFPTLDSNFLFLIMKIIAIFSKDHILVTHIYYILTYIFISFTTYYVFRKFNIKPLISGSTALLFSFLPYHILRGVYHISYSSYYFVPLMMLTVFWIWSKKPIFFKYADKKWKIDFGNKKAIFTIITAILSGISCIYFEIFYSYFVLIAGFSAYFYRKNIHNLFSAFIIIVMNFIVVALNAMPYIVYKIQYGANAKAVVRFFPEAEIYALKIVQMILPVNDHFIFAKWKQNYNIGALLVNENAYVSLGIIGVIVFIAILFYFIAVRNRKFNLYDKCGTIIISALLLGTVGSFSSFIAFTVLPEIRSYNRIAVFISFVVFLAFAVFLQKNIAKIKNKFAYFCLIALITLIGLRDLIPTTAHLSIGYLERAEYYKQLKTFVKIMEKVNQKGAMIFQLPYIEFPEVEEIRGILWDYELMKPYLVSDKLRWSYGTMKGRSIDEWYKKTSRLPAEKLIKEIKGVGFSGLLISKKGYDNTALDDLRYKYNTIFKKPTIENNEFIYYKF